MDLVALVERARGGDVDAFTALVERYQRLAHGSAVTVVHDADIARDVVQESFIAAWRGLPGLLDPKAFPAWVRGIVRRQALHVLRSRRLESLVDAPGLLDDRPSAEQSMEAARRRELAFAALAALPDGLREAAVLRWVHDCSQAQIAIFLDLPVFIAEPYTNLPGSFVPRAETVAACAAILDGAYDDVPEEAFRFTGRIEQVLARARRGR